MILTEVLDMQFEKWLRGEVNCRKNLACMSLHVPRHLVLLEEVQLSTSIRVGGEHIIQTKRSMEMATQSTKLVD